MKILIIENFLLEEPIILLLIVVDASQIVVVNQLPLVMLCNWAHGVIRIQLGLGEGTQQLAVVVGSLAVSASVHPAEIEGEVFLQGGVLLVI